MMVLDRRTLLERALLLVGATVVPGGAQALAAAAAEGPRHLEPARYALLTSVADTIVPRTDTPGAVDAEVPRMFDAMLRNWASPQRRAELIGALDAIDRLAGARGGFATLSPAKRHALLAPHDAAALAPPASSPGGSPPVASPPIEANPDYGRPQQTPPQTKEGATTKQAGESLTVMTGPPVTDPAYSKLKELIVTLYYVSEPALTTELAYEHDPGEWQPSIPITPQTRPSGGIGNI